MSTEPEEQVLVEQRDLPPAAHGKALLALVVALAAAFFAAKKFFL